MKTINYSYRGIIPYKMSFCYKCGENLSGIYKLYLCDWVVDLHANNPDERECNRKMCLDCANTISPMMGTFLCDEHYEENKENIKLFNSDRLEYEHKKEKKMKELEVESFQKEVSDRISRRGYELKIILIDNSPKVTMISNLINRFNYKLAILKDEDEIIRYDIKLDFFDIVEKFRSFLSERGELK